ncbi:MAG: hypothetical protein II292_04510, partial [Clostridia bacterium]|nr:hypothetical protein [Clostridia bacterium]
GGFWSIVAGIFGGLFALVDVPAYVGIFDEFSGGFNVAAWILAILTMVVVLALLIALVMLVIIFVKRRIRAYNAVKNQLALVEEVGKLNAQVIRLTKERTRYLPSRQARPIFLTPILAAARHRLTTRREAHLLLRRARAASTSSLRSICSTPITTERLRCSTTR